MQRPAPEQTKLLICIWHPFTYWRPPASVAEAIRERYPRMKICHLPDFQNVDAEIPDTDLLLGPSIRPDQFAQAKKLKWIHSTAAGVSQLMYPELRESEVVVTNAGGIFSPTMAEHTIGLMIALARNFPDSVRAQDQSRWAQNALWEMPQHLTELRGRTLLIAGYGSIGKELAKRARAFDLRIIGVTRTGKGDASVVDRIVGVDSLDEVLPQADYVVVAAPETPQTKELIGAAQMARMKRGSRLINIARGSLIDESALVRALQSGHLGGAALDVVETEPLPADSPLWKAPNLFITPHTSGVTDQLWAREVELYLELLDRWFSARELFNLVDLRRGY